MHTPAVVASAVAPHPSPPSSPRRRSSGGGGVSRSPTTAVRRGGGESNQSNNGSAAAADEDVNDDDDERPRRRRRSSSSSSQSPSPWASTLDALGARARAVASALTSTSGRVSRRGHVDDGESEKRQKLRDDKRRRRVEWGDDPHAFRIASRLAPQLGASSPEHARDLLTAMVGAVTVESSVTQARKRLVVSNP